jgi:hypothetical protein
MRTPTPLSRPLVLLTAAGLVAALGCAGKKDKGEDDTSAAGDDSGTLDTPEIDWTGDCPSASGIVAGATWTYEYNEAYEKSSSLSGGYTMEVTDFGTDGTLTLVTQIDSAGSNNTYTATQTDTYSCNDEGLWLLDTYLEYTTTVYYAYEGYQDYTWNVPTLIMPVTVEVGDDWESVYDGVYETELGQRRAQDYTTTTTVTGREEIDVPAGTYTAMVWNAVTSLGSNTTTYVANGTGAVATPYADLVEVEQ